MMSFFSALKARAACRGLNRRNDKAMRLQSPLKTDADGVGGGGRRITRQVDPLSRPSVASWSS